MQVDDRVVNLSPGMAVTVEIKTGSRRIIEYLLSAADQISAGKPARPVSSNILLFVGVQRFLPSS